MQDIQKRLHRVVGQITAVETAIEQNQSCETVLPQLLAAKGALDASVQTYLETSIDTCVHDTDVPALKKVLKLFIKHIS